MSRAMPRFVGCAPASRHCAASVYEFEETMRPPGDVLVGLDELVAAREDRDARPAVDRTTLRPSDASRPSCAAPRRVPAASTLSPARTSSPAGRTCSPSFGAAKKRTRAPAGSVVLLHHDGVGARRERRAGEDARGLAGPRAAAGPRPPAGTSKATGERAGRRAARPGEVGRADRVAVHGRAVRGREGAAGGDRLRQHAPEGVRNRHGLGRERPDPVEHEAPGLVDRDAGAHRADGSASTQAGNTA